MIWNSYKFKSNYISKVASDYRVWLTKVDWRWLDTSDEQVDIAGYHGIRLSPTYARGRRITIEWLILADSRVGLSKAMDYLDRLFALQYNNFSVTEFSSFVVTDEQNRDWEIQCKVKEPVEYIISDDDYMDWANRKFRVVLQSEDPRYFWPENTLEGIESIYWGIKQLDKRISNETTVYWWIELPAELPSELDSSYTITTTSGIFGGIKLPNKFNYYFNTLTITNPGNSESPLIITITVNKSINSPLLFKNLTNNKYFWLDVSAVARDVIIIDSSKFTCTKNWTNILASRIEGSTWPKIIWTNSFGVIDNDQALFESDFDITIKFKNSLL